MLPEAVIFTDGSSSPKTLQGGWAAIVMLPTHFVELVGCAEQTTNNRMEMMAAIQGLKELKVPHKVYLVSDSAYLLNTIAKRWYNRWFADEMFFDGQYAKQMGRFPRPNLDLWRVISSLAEFHEIVTIKVKGHSIGEDGHEYNHRVDELALKARTQQLSSRRELPNGYDDAEEGFREMVSNGSGILVSEGKVNGDSNP